MSEWNLPWSAGCRCDGLRMRISEPPIVTMACHCAGCQRMSASAFSLSILVPASGFEVTQGDAVIGGLHGPSRHFHCAHCKTWAFTRPEGLTQFVNVRATMLDDAKGFEPFIETYTSEKLAWAATPAVRSFAKFPSLDDYTELTAQYAKARQSATFDPVQPPRGSKRE